LIRRYEQTITPRKRSAPIERFRIRVVLKHEIVKILVSELRPAHFACYRDERLKRVSGETARKDLILLRHVFEVARRDWGLKVTNPVTDVQKPPPCKPRNRRLNDGELAALLTAVKRCRNATIESIIRFAIETGMRRGELLRTRWAHVDWDRRTLLIGEAKNGHPRVIPLSSAAIAILKEVRNLHATRVFPTTASAVRQAWVRLTRRAGIADLRFHDLRHEAVSRFFEKGLSVPQVALISGHRDARMLFRYTHLRAEDLVALIG
jgi:integrase